MFTRAEQPGVGQRHNILHHAPRTTFPLNGVVPAAINAFGADSKDHGEEFRILVKELEKYNPELLHKQFIIAISKSDMLDAELKEAIAKELPENISHLFISSITQQGLTELKDLLWKVLNTPPDAAAS